LGEGLGVCGFVILLIFVIVWVYFSEVDGFLLVYVDVYWFGFIVEVDDFDFDVSFEDCVMVVEWG